MKVLNKLALLAFVVFGSCTERIELDLNNAEFQRLVVEGLLTNETKAHKVSLRLTSDYFAQEEPPLVAGAVVTISDGSQTITLTENSPGDYFTPATMAGIPGRSYTLKVEWDGQTYTSTAALKGVAPIEDIEAIEEEDQEEEGEMKEYAILLYTTEPEGEGDHYYWRGFPAAAPDDIERTYWEIASDEFVDGSLIDGAEILFIEAEKGESFVIEQYGLNEEAFDFYLAIQFETDFKGGIFDPPPANINGNIDNGALGYFLTASVVRDTVLIE